MFTAIFIIYSFVYCCVMKFHKGCGFGVVSVLWLQRMKNIPLYNLS